MQFPLNIPLLLQLFSPLRVIVLSALLLALMPLAGWSATLPDGYAQLKTGQVIVHPVTEQGTNGGKAIEAIILIQRPMAQVWNVIKNTETLFASDPNFKQVKVVKRPSPTREIVQYELKLSPLLPVMSYMGQVDFLPGKGTSFKRLSGSFKAMDGGTRLQPGATPSETILTYKLFVEPAIPVPQAVVNRFVGSDLPKSLSRVKQQIYQAYPGK